MRYDFLTSKNEFSARLRVFDVYFKIKFRLFAEVLMCFAELEHFNSPPKRNQHGNGAHLNLKRLNSCKNDEIWLFNPEKRVLWTSVRFSIPISNVFRLLTKKKNSKKLHCFHFHYRHHIWREARNLDLSKTKQENCWKSQKIFFRMTWKNWGVIREPDFWGFKDVSHRFQTFWSDFHLTFATPPPPPCTVH